MNTVAIPIRSISAPDFNPNSMDEDMRAHLRNSIKRFGVVVPIVVRLIGENSYETIGGAQRLAVLNELKYDDVPCVVVDADDNEARLLCQALNHIAGQDNPGLRAQLLRDLLENVDREQIGALLPGVEEDLKSLATLGQEDLAQQLKAWDKARSVRLRRLQFQLTQSQLEALDCPALRCG